MKILVVDNGTSYLEKLKDLLAGHRLEIEKFGDIDLNRVGDFDFVVLSGGHEFPVVGNEKKFEKEIQLLQDTETPVLGICLGFELMAHVFGATLKLMRKKERGIVDIYPSIESPLFEGIDELRVYESHRWVVDAISDELVEIARSKDGIEMIQRVDAPLYGFQFHPEMFVDQAVGDDIFKNLLKEIEKR